MVHFIWSSMRSYTHNILEFSSASDYMLTSEL